MERLMNTPTPGDLREWMEQNPRKAPQSVYSALNLPGMIYP